MTNSKILEKKDSVLASESRKTVKTENGNYVLFDAFDGKPNANSFSNIIGVTPSFWGNLLDK